MTSFVSALARRLRSLGDPYTLVLLLTVAALARFPFLGHSIADLDETSTWYHTNHALEEGIRIALGRAMEAPLFMGMNTAIAHVFGLTILNLRIPQAIFGTLSVPLVFLLMRRVHSTRLALLTALLTASSPYLIFYSMQARAYSQMLFFSILFCYTFFRVQGWKSTIARRLVLVVCTALAVGSHFYSLVFLAAFYAVLLGDHLRCGRRDRLKSDFVTGLLTLVAILPLLAILVVLLGRMPGAYWKVNAVTLPSILTEQLWLPGTTLGSGGLSTTAINLLGATLLFLPLGHTLLRRGRLIGAYPHIALLWLVSPCIPVFVGVLSGLDLLHYPRAHIASSPFLFAYWLLFTASMEIGKWWKRAFVAAVMTPFLVSSLAVVTNHPSQAFFKNREVMVDIASQIEAHRDEYDLVAVHHWFLAPFVKYHLSHPEEVIGLGALLRKESSHSGELSAILDDLAALPPDARVLLMLNEITDVFDRQHQVLRTLLITRPVIKEIPCHAVRVPGDTILCSRVILFDAVVPPPEVTEVTPIQQEADALLDQALLLLNEGDFQKGELILESILAVSHYDAIVEKDPERQLAYLGAAAALLRLDRYQEAEERLSQGLSVDPHSTTLHHALARILAGSPLEYQRKPTRALELALAIHEHRPGPYHAETVAMALAAVGRFSEAVEWQRELMAGVAGAASYATLSRLERNLSRYEAGLSCCAEGEITVELPLEWAED